MRGVRSSRVVEVRVVVLVLDVKGGVREVCF